MGLPASFYWSHHCPSLSHGCTHCTLDVKCYLGTGSIYCFDALNNNKVNLDRIVSLDNMED